MQIECREVCMCRPPLSNSHFSAPLFLISPQVPTLVKSGLGYKAGFNSERDLVSSKKQYPSDNWLVLAYIDKELLSLYKEICSQLDFKSDCDACLYKYVLVFLGFGILIMQWRLSCIKVTTISSATWVSSYTNTSGSIMVHEIILGPL